MTKIKLCGLSRPCDIEAANRLLPDYVGFIFASRFRRYVPPATAEGLKKLLDLRIQAVGVFVDEKPQVVADLLNGGLIDRAQLHGKEDEEYLCVLRSLTDRPFIKAFSIRTRSDLSQAARCSADEILLDAGTGTGRRFDWELLQGFERDYILAGGLDADNVSEAIARLDPYGVDCSSGIETDGVKDPDKMAAFVAAVRKEGKR